MNSTGAHDAEPGEARISAKRAVLCLLSDIGEPQWVRDFCGSVVGVGEDWPDLTGKTVYLCGDLTGAPASALEKARRVLVVRDHAAGLDGSWPVVGLGRVPQVVEGVGVYYRRFFDVWPDYFARICSEHAFQSLTQSTRPGKAHRTGIYLSPVRPTPEGLRFQLLRCSTNLSGPTENFGPTDAHIVDALNQEAGWIFENQAPLNHVLAQVYHNTPATLTRKQTKAKINSHADKTKDMPQNGFMAFCTFYDGLEHLQPMASDRFDLGHRKASGLTRLHFRLKAAVAAQPGLDLPKQFTVTLYPDSVFFMPLSTNRLYTHEIRSSGLDAVQLPTRLGYVVRCSSTEAVHAAEQTFLKRAGTLTALQPPTPEGMAALRKLYAEENTSDGFIDYGDRFRFSMNRGDYEAPVYSMADEFRRYLVPAQGNLYEALQASIRFDRVGRGRLGAVLVKPDAARGVPIVRTTTCYKAPAHRFRPVHEGLAKQIEALASLPMGLNNALIEIYKNAYTRMGFHSDQALDLEPGSSIALFSCYQNPDLNTRPRVLVITEKGPGGQTVEVPLLHNSVVVFSLDTNRRFKHKIVLDASGQAENPWLGITYRTSATFVQPQGTACFEDGRPLRLATEAQRQALYPLRRRENNERDFAYPSIGYTLSESDLMPPV